MRVYALTGLSGSGKSTVAAIMANRLPGLVVESFARPLKDALKAVGVPHASLYGNQAEKETVIHPWGMSGRELMISLGTEWGRDQIRKTLWADLLVERIRGVSGMVVVDDLRFLSEISAIRTLPARVEVIRVERPGITEGHRYEIDEIKPSRVLVNDSYKAIHDFIGEEIMDQNRVRD